MNYIGAKAIISGYAEHYSWFGINYNTPMGLLINAESEMSISLEKW